MKTYSVSEAARILEVDRTTLRRWVREKQIPAPTPGIVRGRLSKFWTEEEFDKIKEHKTSGYWGKGVDRKTGQKAKRKG
jgi:excisionase family DNA binding protein